MADFDKIQEARAKALEVDMKTAGLSGRALSRLSGVDDKIIRDLLKRRKACLDDTWGRLATTPEIADGQLAALLTEAGVEIPAPVAPARTAPVTAAAGMRQDALPSSLTLLAWNELEPGDNYRKSFPEEELLQLAESIAEKGLLQNIVARPIKAADDAQPSVLRPARLVAGERRWRAIGELVKQGRWNGAERNIPVRLESLDDTEARALALIENLQRQEVPVLEEAEGFKALTALGWDTEKIAAACHIAQRTVQDRLQLFDKLKPVARMALAEGQITLDQARAIVSTPFEAEQNELVTLAVRNGYNAASLRDRAKRGKVPVRRAAFELKLYKGEFIGTGADRVFADTDAFMKLQHKAAQKKAEEIEATGRFACVTLLEPGKTFDHSRYIRRWEEDVTEENASRIEVLVSVDKWSHEIEVEYGEPMTDAGEDEEEFEEKSDEQLELEREIARKKREEEAASATRWCRDMLAAVGERPADYFRREILLALTGIMPSWWPNHLKDGGMIDNLPATLEILQKATGRAFRFDQMEEDVALTDIPRNEHLGYLLDDDATFVANWLNDQPDMEVIRLYVRLEASRCLLGYRNALDRETLALSERLGVVVPAHMIPEPEEPEDGHDLANEAEEELA